MGGQDSAAAGGAQKAALHELFAKKCWQGQGGCKGRWPRSGAGKTGRKRGGKSMAEGERMTEAGLGRALVWGAIGQKDSQNWVPHSG